MDKKVKEAIDVAERLKGKCGLIGKTEEQINQALQTLISYVENSEKKIEELTKVHLPLTTIMVSKKASNFIKRFIDKSVKLQKENAELKAKLEKYEGGGVTHTRG